MAKYKRKDIYYEKAQEDGYRSRASYKLMEIQKKYHLMKRGSAVLDLGCWPGGWLQVAASTIGEHGLAVGIDLVRVDPLLSEQVHLIEGDLRDEESLEQIKALSPKGYDVVLSDMSPKLTGIKERDAALSTGCGELAFFAAQQVLRIGGHFVVKLFNCQEAQEFVRFIQPHFQAGKRTVLKSTRTTSNEFYFIGQKYSPRE